MILDLELQEIVDSRNRLRIAAGNLYSCATRRLLHVVLDIFAQFFHGWHARWRLSVNQHRRFEVPVMEHLGDVLEMGADLLAAGCVGWISCERLDCSAIWSESEMMNGFLMREAHHLIAALDYPFVVLIRSLLSISTKAQHGRKSYTVNIFHAALDALSLFA